MIPHVRLRPYAFDTNVVSLCIEGAGTWTCRVVDGVDPPAPERRREVVLRGDEEGLPTPFARAYALVESFSPRFSEPWEVRDSELTLTLAERTPEAPWLEDDAEPWPTWIDPAVLDGLAVGHSRDLTLGPGDATRLAAATGAFLAGDRLVIATVAPRLPAATTLRELRTRLARQALCR